LMLGPARRGARAPARAWPGAACGGVLERKTIVITRATRQAYRLL
jgi:hypothetical protein